LIGKNGSGATPPQRTPSVGAILVMAALALLLGWGFYRGRRERRRTDQLGPTEAPRPGDILLFFRPNRARDHVIEWMSQRRSPRPTWPGYCHGLCRRIVPTDPIVGGKGPAVGRGLRRV
jgi:hypothetical protein